MAYATSNPPRRISLGSIDNSQGGTSQWVYTSADAAATVAGAGYITNGGDLGMQVNDLVQVIDTATPLITSHRVKTVSSTSPGAVNLSAGTTVGATA